MPFSTMSQIPKRDPNRYASTLEADAIRARLPDERAELEVLARKVEHAEAAQREAEAQFREIEVQYLAAKEALDDYVSYTSEARRRRDAQAEAITTQHSLLHPMRKTPTEVLGLIFELCLPQLDVLEVPEAYTAQRVRERQRQPLRLAAVCKRWREACLSWPRVWRFLDVHFNTDAGSLNVTHLKSVRLVLARSGACPLTIRIARPIRQAKPNVAQSQTSILRELVPAMARCQFFGILAHFEADMGLSTLVTSATPALVDIFIWSLCPGGLSTMRIFPDAPKLSSLQGRLQRFDARTAFPSLRTAILHEAVSSTQQDDLRFILSTSPELRTIAIQSPRVSHSNYAPLVAPSVHELVAYDAGDSHLLAERFVFPNLSDISLSCTMMSSRMLATFLKAVSMTSPTITIVSIDDLSSKKIVEATSVITSFGSLQSLTFRYGTLDRLALDTLWSSLDVSTPGEPWPCPLLHAVHLVACNFAEDCDPEHLLDVLRRRIAAAMAEDDAAPSLTPMLSVVVDNWAVPGRADIQPAIDLVLHAE